MIIGNKNLTQFDVLVIGSGAGGSAVADILTANGKKVLVLEAGSNYLEGLDLPGDYPNVRFSNDEVKNRRGFGWPDPLVDPMTFRKSEKKGDRTHTGLVNPLPKTVGGGFMYADVKVPRFVPTDFQLGSLLEPVSSADFADWPVSYDELEPFYTYSEYMMGVQGVAGSMPGEGHRSAPFPMEPGLPMYSGLKLSQAATQLGYSPIPYPTAANARPYRGRPACMNCGYCSGYGCMISAKGTPAVTMLRKALLSENCQLVTETKAVRLLVSSSGREVTGVEAMGPGGERRIYQADRYILAASPVEDARLLFLSDPSGIGIGNSSGRVGRDLTFHLQNIVTGVFEERMHTHRGRCTTQGLPDFRGVPGNPNRPLGGIIEFAATQMPIGETLEYMQRLHLRGGFLKDLIRESPLRDHMVALIMQAEDAPQLTNRVDLDPEVKDMDGYPVARVTYRSHKWELSTRKFYLPKMLELLKVAGAKYGIVAPADEIPNTAHIMGTLRFGHDPKTSVCAADGRFHDLGNLYAADGSLFPTSSGFNPTLTIVALAARIAAGIVSPQSPEQAIPQISG